MGKNVKNRNLPKKKSANISVPTKAESVLSKPKFKAIIAIAVVVVILIVGGIYLFSKTSNKTDAANKTSSNNTSSISTPTQSSAVSATNTSTSVQPTVAQAAPSAIPATSAEIIKKATDVSIMTAKGEIVVALRPDLMPITVNNFMKLVNQGFYDGLNFHRVEDWVIQGGDPKGDGTGGPGWSIKLETSPELKNVKYAIAMARSQDPDSAGSQFYILKKDSSFLDGQYAVFGNVIKGQDVVDKIAIGDKMTTVKEVK